MESRKIPDTPSKLPVIELNIQLIMADLVKTAIGAQKKERLIILRLTCRRNIRLLKQEFNSKLNFLKFECDSCSNSSVKTISKKGKTHQIFYSIEPGVFANREGRREGRREGGN